MSDLLTTGKSALFAFQRALGTTSHNIANVDTEGYSRQRVDFQAVGDDRATVIDVGRGVRVADIERVQDVFAKAQVDSATADHSQQQTYHAMASKIDNLIADPALSITPAINLFFESVQDANNDPSSTANRAIVLDSAERLTQRFQTMQDQLDTTQTEVNDRTRQAINEVDEIAQSLAEINRRVATVNNSTVYSTSNDLKDQRDQLVNDLSQYIEVNTVEEDSGALNVYIGKGISLVVGGTAQKLEAVTDDIYPDRLKIQIGNDNLKQDLRPMLQGGEIGGLNEFVTNTLHPTMQEVGRVAIVMADQINAQNAMGIDNNGDRGIDIFETPLPQTYSSSRNGGTGALSATIDDSSALKGSDYMVRYESGTVRVTRSSDGVESTGTVPMSFDGLTIDLSGSPSNGDTFVLSPSGRAAGGFNTAQDDPAKLALSSPLSTASSINNLGDSRISTATAIDLDATGFNDPVSFVFTSSTTFDIVDATTGITLSGGQVYAEDVPIQINGWQVSLSGTAKPGDLHTVEPNTQGRGNNANGLALSAIQQATTVDGNDTLNTAYGALVSRVGAHTRSAESRTEALESLMNSAIDRKQSAQGVNLDEEAVNLTRYQQAYQASAQIISTADQLFQTILGATS